MWSPRLRQVGCCGDGVSACDHVSWRRLFAGVLWVDASLSYDEASCVFQISAALRACPTAHGPGGPPSLCTALSLLVDSLRLLRVLLVLDNCDALYASGVLSKVVKAVSAACGGVCVLLTMRPEADGVCPASAWITVVPMSDATIGRLFTACTQRPV